MNELKKIQKQIESSKKIMAKERDKLRELIEDLEDIEYRFAKGNTSLEIASGEIEIAIEMFSEIV